VSRRDEFEPIGEEAYSILTQFYEYDREVPLDARVLQRDEHESFVRETVAFRGLHHSRIPGYLMIPAPGSPPCPCILLAHGMGGSKERWSEAGSDPATLAVELLSAGFALLALDGPCHGERTSDVDYASVYSWIQPNSYRELIVQWTVEHRLAMDYLATRPEVDSARIGIVGYSLGGVMAYDLTGVDSRIKATVIGSTAPLTRHYLNVIGWDEIALARMMPIAPQTFAPAIKNVPFLMLHGKDDAYGTLEGARALYELVSSPTKELVLFDSGHVLPAAHISLVVEWFRRHLSRAI
jgi:dipeptidyl aminopeptidase/acylaminoacyl peptidase